MSVSGTCYCGAVKVTCTGEPKVCAVCHCKSCAKVRAPEISKSDRNVTPTHTPSLSSTTVG